MAHRAHHHKLQASSLVLPLSAPAMKSQLNTAFQFPIRSTFMAIPKTQSHPPQLLVSKGSRSQRVSGMKTVDLDWTGNLWSTAEWFLLRILGVSYGTWSECAHFTLPKLKFFKGLRAHLIIRGSKPSKSMSGWSSVFEHFFGIMKAIFSDTKGLPQEICFHHLR